MPLTKRKQLKILKKSLKEKHLSYLNDLVTLLQVISHQTTRILLAHIISDTNKNQAPSHNSTNWLADKIKAIQQIKTSLLSTPSKKSSQDLVNQIDELEESVDCLSDPSVAIDKLEKRIRYFYSDPFLVKITRILQEVHSQKELAKTLSEPNSAKKNPPIDCLAHYILFLKNCPYVKRLPFSTVDDIEFIGLDNLKSILENNLYIVESKVIFGDPDKSAEYESLIAPYIETHVINREYVDIIEPYTNKGLPTPKGADKNLPTEVPLTTFKRRFKKAAYITQERVSLELESIERTVCDTFTLFHVGINTPFEMIESFIAGDLAIRQHARKNQDPRYKKKIEVSLALLAKLLHDFNIALTPTNNNPDLTPLNLTAPPIELFSILLPLEVIEILISQLRLELSRMPTTPGYDKDKTFRKILDFVLLDEKFFTWCENVAAANGTILALNDDQRQLSNQEKETKLLAAQSVLVLLLSDYFEIIRAAKLDLTEEQLNDILGPLFVKKSEEDKKPPQFISKTITFKREGDPDFKLAYKADIDSQTKKISFTKNTEKQTSESSQEPENAAKVKTLDDTPPQERRTTRKTPKKGVQKLAKPNNSSKESKETITEDDSKKTPLEKRKAEILKQIADAEGIQNKSTLIRNKKAYAIRQLLQQQNEINERERQLSELFSKYSLLNTDDELTKNLTVTKSVDTSDNGNVEFINLRNSIQNTLAEYYPEYKDLIKVDATTLTEIRDKLINALRKILLELDIEDQIIRLENGYAYIIDYLESDNSFKLLEIMLKTSYIESIRESATCKNLDKLLEKDAVKRKIEEVKNLYSALEKAQNEAELFTVDNRLIEAAVRRKSDPLCASEVRSAACSVTEEIETIFQFRTGEVAKERREKSIASESLKSLSPEFLEDTYNSLSRGKGDAATTQQDWETLKKNTESLLRKLKLRTPIPADNLKRLILALNKFAKLCNEPEEQQKTTSRNTVATTTPRKTPKVLPAINSKQPKERKVKLDLQPKVVILPQSAIASATTPSIPLPKETPIAASKPAAAKIEIIVRKPLSFSPKPDAPEPANSTKKSNARKLPIKSAATTSASLLNQILQEATALSSELKLASNSTQPYYLTNHIDRLSLRYDTYQMFHKIYLITAITYQDMLALSPSDPLVNSLDEFCKLLRAFRNYLIHRPNYVDQKLESEVIEFILNSQFINWYTELNSHIKIISRQVKSLADKDNHTDLANILLGLREGVQLLGAYQHLKESNTKVVTFDECREQLLFALKLMAFNEEKLEANEQPYYKQRRIKTSSMLAVIIYEYGCKLQDILKPEDVIKLKATPLYQLLSTPEKMFDSSNLSLLDRCHHFRNKNMARISETTGEIEMATRSIDTITEIAELKQIAKKICGQLGINHLEDPINIKPANEKTTLTKLAPTTSSQQRILSTLRASAPAFIPTFSLTTAPPATVPVNPQTSRSFYDENLPVTLPLTAKIPAVVQCEKATDQESIIDESSTQQPSAAP